MSEGQDGGEEILSENFRRRQRVMGRLSFPFDILSALEFLAYAVVAIGATVFVISRL